MDRGAWWAIVHGVAKSQTWLKWLSNGNSNSYKTKRFASLFQNYLAVGSWGSLVTIDSWFTSPWYSNCQNSVIYLGSSFLLFSFYFELKWKKWNTELESSRVNKESSFLGFEVYTRLQFNTGIHEIDSLWPAKKSRSHLQPPVPMWLSLCVFICWGKTHQVAGKRTTFKKDDMKMIEPQTIELGSIHLRD